MGEVAPRWVNNIDHIEQVIPALSSSSPVLLRRDSSDISTLRKLTFGGDRVRLVRKISELTFHSKEDKYGKPTDNSQAPNLKNAACFF